MKGIFAHLAFVAATVFDNFARTKLKPFQISRTA